MTGRGCDDIFRILDSRNYTFGDMFRRCERRYGRDNFHFTRLDIAIDDKNEKPFFTIEQIKKKCEKEEFISNSEGYHFDESKFDDFDTAKTVYIGAGKSGLSYRFYDKDKTETSVSAAFDSKNSNSEFHFFQSTLNVSNLPVFPIQKNLSPSGIH